MDLGKELLSSFFRLQTLVSFGLYAIFLGAPTVHTCVTKTHQNLPNSAANKYSSASHHGQKNKKNSGQIKFWVVTIKQ